VEVDGGRRLGDVLRPDGRLLPPWFLFIEAVNLALIVALLWLDWPSRSVVGA